MIRAPTKQLPVAIRWPQLPSVKIGLDSATWISTIYSIPTTTELMIIYDLCCPNGHSFEGWFRSADDFETQIESHLVCCPQCDSHNVRRIPSAVAISSHHLSEHEHSTDTSSISSGGSTALMPVGTQAMALYRQLIQTIVNNSEDVGQAFAEEARKIHYNEAPERPIRGQATADECDALRDEGIQILHLPPVKEEDLN